MLEIIQFFRLWCEQKIALHLARRTPLFKQGEIWWCSIGVNVGEEIYGKGKSFRRPVLIFKKFTHNSFLGLPLTSQEKTGSWFVEFKINGQKNWAMLNQARILDARRLGKRIAVIQDTDFIAIKKRLVDFYNS